MKDSRLLELRNNLVNYDKINSNEKINLFCHECEDKGLLSPDEKLERISHGADSDDFSFYVQQKYNNDIPIMFLMLDPSPSTHSLYFSLTDDDGNTKEVPKQHHYWTSNYIRHAITREEIINGSIYDLYWWYLQNRHLLNNVYVTNVIKCHCSSTNHRIKSNCIENYLKKEIEIFNPKAIFCMGSKVQYIMNHKPMKNFITEKNIKVAKLYHISWCESYHRISKEEFLDYNDSIIESTLSELKHLDKEVSE